MLATRDEQAVLLASFKTAHCNRSARQLMVLERHALVDILDQRVAAAAKCNKTRVSLVEEHHQVSEAVENARLIRQADADAESGDAEAHAMRDRRDADMEAVKEHFPP